MLFAVARAGGQSTSYRFSTAFDSVDRHAQEVARHLKCLGDASLPGRRGGIAASDTAGTHLMCARWEGGLAALYIATDSTWKVATKFAAFDPVSAARIMAPFDTANVLLLLRARRYAQWMVSKGPPGPSDSVGYLPPVVYRTDTVIQVWIIPGAILPVQADPRTGGEYHYVLPRDARKEISVDSNPVMRPIRKVQGSEWIVESRDSVPNFSELLFVNILSLGGIESSIVTPTRVAKLVGPPDMAMWVFLPRKP